MYSCESYDIRLTGTDEDHEHRTPFDTPTTRPLPPPRYSAYIQPHYRREDGGWFVAPIIIQRVPSVTKILAEDAMRERLIERFRSEHADLFPPEASNRPAAEFLDQCAVIFQCTACESVYHFKDAESHGTECTRSPPSPRSIESSTPAKHSIVILVLSLLEVLELPQDVTFTSATEALKDVRFVCLCGDPRYEGHFDFKGLVGTLCFVTTSATELVL